MYRQRNEDNTDRKPFYRRRKHGPDTVHDKHKDRRIAKATVEQIRALTAAGCEIIRSAVPTMEAAKALAEIKRNRDSTCGRHTFRLQTGGRCDRENGADKIRINPGNIGGRK